MNGKDEHLGVEGVQLALGVDQVLAVLPVPALIDFDVDPFSERRQTEERHQLGRRIAAQHRHSRLAPGPGSGFASHVPEGERRRLPLEEGLCLKCRLPQPAVRRVWLSELPAGGGDLQRPFEPHRAAGRDCLQLAIESTLQIFSGRVELGREDPCSVHAIRVCAGRARRRKVKNDPALPRCPLGHRESRWASCPGTMAKKLTPALPASFIYSSR